MWVDGSCSVEAQVYHRRSEVSLGSISSGCPVSKSSIWDELGVDFDRRGARILRTFKLDLECLVYSLWSEVSLDTVYVQFLYFDKDVISIGEGIK